MSQLIERKSLRALIVTDDDALRELLACTLPTALPKGAKLVWLDGARAVPKIKVASADDLIVIDLDTSSARGELRLLIRHEQLPAPVIAIASDDSPRLEPPRGAVCDVLGRHELDGRSLERSLRYLGALRQARIFNAERVAADAASEAKSRFLANVSHEMRTPLTAVLGFSEILQSGTCAPEDCEEMLDTIVRNSRHLVGLIDDIMDLSKIELGRVSLEPVEVELGTLLAEVRDTLMPAAEAKNLEFEMTIAPDVPPHVVTDRLRLRQILLNLLSNAVKFTDHGHVRLVLLTESALGARRLVLRVIDSGVGIAREHWPRLFQPFSQADGTIGKRFGGSGLGLTLSKSLATALGGDLILESSEPGKGATFALRLPLDKAPTEMAADQGEELPDSRSLVARLATAEPNAILQGKRILVVEDQLDNQRLFELILTRAGARVDIAPNGREGIAKALSVRYDIVFMDIQMPVLDGFEATRELRRHGYARPIVALTAHALPDHRTACLDAGCTKLMAKPVQPSDLIRTAATLQ